jgi:hypothetical protein
MIMRLLRTIYYAAGPAMAFAGASNVAFGYTSTDVTTGLAGGLLLWLLLLVASPALVQLARPVRYAPPNEPDPTTQDDLRFHVGVPRGRPAPPPHPELAYRQSSRVPSLATIGIVVGIIAGIVTIVDGIMDFVSKVS